MQESCYSLAPVIASPMPLWRRWYWPSHWTCCGGWRSDGTFGPNTPILHFFFTRCVTPGGLYSIFTPLSLTGERLNPRQWWHFLPLAFIFLIVHLTYWQLSSTQQLELLNYMWGPREEPSGEVVVWGFLSPVWRPIVDFKANSLVFGLQFACYCMLVIRQIRVHNRRMEQQFSSLEQMNLRWLRGLSVTSLVFIGLFLVLNRVPLVMLEYFDRSAPLANLHIFALVILLYGIAISALLQPSLVSGVIQAVGSEPNWHIKQDRRSFPEDRTDSISNDTTQDSNSGVEAVDAPPDRSAKYHRARLGIEEAQRYKIRLMEVMEEQELCLKEDLTVPDLARASGVTAPQISQILNGQMNQNFFSFVNNYRIQLAQRMLLDPQTSGMPIVELAVEVGFKSKSSFYDAFKRATNMTPTQFKRAMEKPPQPEDKFA